MFERPVAVSQCLAQTIQRSQHNNGYKPTFYKGMCIISIEEFYREADENLITRLRARWHLLPIEVRHDTLQMRVRQIENGMCRILAHDVSQETSHVEK